MFLVQDILHIEQELYSQQKYVVGILAGLQEDFGLVDI